MSGSVPNIRKSGEVLYFQFQRLAREPGLRHAVFTRLGGVSEPPYFSLNTSFSTGDDPEHVRKNLSIVKEVLGAERVFWMEQVHGSNILVLRGETSSEFSSGIAADAVIARTVNLALMVKQADCQGIILYDPDPKVIAAVHCGWRGNVLNILGSVVERMVSEMGCRPSRILAAIGPSLGPCCAEFVTYREIFPEVFRSFMVSESRFNLWQISRWQLLEAGVPEGNIESAEICNKCRTDLFFSYRTEKTTGRFATAVMLT